MSKSTKDLNVNLEPSTAAEKGQSTHTTPTSLYPETKTEPKSSKTKPLSIEYIELNTLLKFIKPYNGTRETLNSFIVNCNNAYELATEPQKPIIFKYILCQLQGKAEIACSIKDFTNWDQLKEFLKTQFSERKHYSHLLTELQESKQNANENVSQYALRVETCLSQILTEISLSNTKQKEVAGRIAAMEDLALHHFLIGLLPRISNIVRCKSPKSLNDAINTAISEERIQQSVYRRNENTGSKPSYSKPLTNQTRNIQKPLQTPHPSTSQQRGGSNITCKYCKAYGHDIRDCKKREYNNNRFQRPNFGSQRFGNPNINRDQPRVNFTIETEDEGHDEVDTTKDNDDYDLNA